MSVCALIAAAGSGKRMEIGQNKAHLLLKGKPVLIHVLSAFEACDAVDDIIIIAAPGEIDFTWGLIKAWDKHSKVKKIIPGGATRQKSIMSGIRNLGSECDIVVIHDCARPLVRASVISITIAAARRYGAAIVSKPMKDTVKLTEGGYITKTLDRDKIRAAGTPQAFRREIIEAAYVNADRDGFVATDDAMVVERSGIKVRVLEDRLDNIKITYREDLAVAETYLAAYNKIDGNNVPNHDYPGQRKFKVGIGFDIHKLVPGRRLILGGVDIPFNLGLEGHSDADVVFHAIADAILGACALGDIGVIFPPTDPSYKGISSGVILSEVVRLAKERGYIVNNVDITVLAEKPKISKFACKMRKNISDFLEIAGEDVGIKATTMEGLGVIGSAEGIACFASCSLIL